MDKYDPSFLPVRAPAPAAPAPAGGGKTNLASCAIAAAFLLLASAAGAATLFVLFRPRDPAIRVTAVQLPGFSLLSNGSSVVSGFSFSEYAAVRNPNRAAFSHYDSSIRLLHAGDQVGFMYIPAGEIAGGRTQYMAATFSVASFPVSTTSGGGGEIVEVEARMKLRGWVRVLKVFVHRVEVVESCRIDVRAADGSVIGVRC